MSYPGRDVLGSAVNVLLGAFLWRENVGHIESARSHDGELAAVGFVPA